MKKTLLLTAAILCLGLSKQSSAQRYLDADHISSITITKDVTYAQNFSVLTGTPTLNDLKMDIYTPNGDPSTLKRPLIILLHTGSFLPKYVNGQATGAKDDTAVVEMARQFAKRGYVVASMTYRLGWNPAALGAAGQDIRTGTLLNAVYRAIQDTKACIRFFKKDAATNGNIYQVDTNRIVLGGQGSGGYVALAATTLDKTAETTLSKFLSSTTNATYGFVAGQSYINQQALGDFEGRGGAPSLNSAATVNAGYTTNVQLVFNMGGALGDLSWMEQGDAPVVAFHVKSDPFAPYKNGNVIVPVTGDFVVAVSGSFEAVKKANDLGNNNILNTVTYNDAYTTRAAEVNEGVSHLFPIVLPGFQSGPWEYWDSVMVKQLPAIQGKTGLQIHRDGMLTNPDMSREKSNNFIDTIQNFLAPRINVALGLTTGINNISAKGAVKLYPNPSNGKVTIEIPALGNNSYAVEILDAMGRVVYKESNINTVKKEISTNTLSNGIHYVRIINGSETRTEKLFINQ